MSAHCPHRIELPTPRRRANALNIEVGTPAPRCGLKEPDHWPNKNMALRWRLSGGSPLVFGLCSEECPLKPTDSHMTPNQFRAAIDRLDLSQVAAAKLVGADPRTARRWALGERDVPECVAILLRLLVAGKITVEDVAAVRR